MNNMIYKKINMKLYIIVQTSKIYTTDLLVKINTTKFRYEYSYSHYVKKDFY